MENKKIIPNVEFYVCNLEEVAERIFSFKKEFDQNINKEGSSVFMSLPSSIKKELILAEKLTPSLKKGIINLLKKESPAQEKLLHFKKSLETEWLKVNALFFSEMHEKCGFEWPYKTYKVGVLFGTCSHYGYDNQIYVSYADFKENEFFYPAFAVGEELFHLGYWFFFEKLFDIKIDDPYDIHFKNELYNIWQISELLPEYYLKSLPFQKFNWHLFNRITGYPWIIEMRELIDPIKNYNLNFENFIIKTHEVCGCTLKVK